MKHSLILPRALAILLALAVFFAAGFVTRALGQFNPPRPATTTHATAAIAAWPLIALPALQALLIQ